MIKVPGTSEGIPVIEKLISLGINVNVTLLFSRDMYRKSAKAYIKGLEKINSEKTDIRYVNSVASFFISRIDTEVDKVIDNKNKGKVAIWNAIKAYEDYEDIFSKDNFKNILNKGGKAQKLLWASTSVKNPNYNKLLYVENLVAPNTVNTVPEDLYNEIINSEINYSSFKQSKNHYDDSEIIDNDKLNIITGELLEVGIKLFEDAFDALIKEIKNKIS